MEQTGQLEPQKRRPDRATAQHCTDAPHPFEAKMALQKRKEKGKLGVRIEKANNCRNPVSSQWQQGEGRNTTKLLWTSGLLNLSLSMADRRALYTTQFEQIHMHEEKTIDLVRLHR